MPSVHMNFCIQLYTKLEEVSVIFLSTASNNGLPHLGFSALGGTRHSQGQHPSCFFFCIGFLVLEMSSIKLELIYIFFIIPMDLQKP